VTAARAVARRSFADSRVRNTSFALLFLFVGVVNPVGYRKSYPTVADRLAFARSFGANKAVELFYGAPHDLLTVGGYTAWRVGGSAAILAAVWGLLAAIRALRAEEDSGRQELVLSGIVSRRAAYVAALAAVAAGAVLLWLALFVGLVAGKLEAGGSAYLALAVVSNVAVFAGVGALASQVAATRRVALELAAAVLALAYALRVVADTSSSFGWARWLTPLGWSEELRPFADPRPAVLVLPVATTAALLLVSGAIALRRDVGSGLIQGRDRAEPRTYLLSSPTAFALRSELGTLAAWIGGTAVFALLIGLLSTSFTNENIPESLREQVEKLGGASITTPAGALGFYFLLFVLAISLFACSQVAAMRRDEAEQELETLFALPVDRRRWLAGRLLLAVGGAAAVAFTAAIVAWIGSATQDAGVPFLRMLEAGANCLPTAVLFLGLGALAFGLVPRASGALAYGLVAAAFVWDLFGGLIGTPGWLLGLSPFDHVGLVPAEPFGATSAVVMLALGIAAAAAGVASFARRDLIGS
jgi:ABC-2 type transport system permease protein